MSMLLAAEWITQASDFLTENWAKLLGILGGTSGIVAILTLIAKIILAVIQGKIQRKNGLPMQTSLNEIKNQIETFISNITDTIKQLQSDGKEELKNYLQEIIEKSQKVKLAIYDKLVESGESAQTMLDELNEKIREEQAILEEIKEKENNIEENPSEIEIVNVEAEKTPKKKVAKKIINEE